MLSNVLKFLLLEVFDNDIVTNRDLKVNCLQLSGLHPDSGKIYLSRLVTTDHCHSCCSSQCDLWLQVCEWNYVRVFCLPLVFMPLLLNLWLICKQRYKQEFDV